MGVAVSEKRLTRRVSYPRLGEYVHLSGSDYGWKSHLPGIGIPPGTQSGFSLDWVCDPTPPPNPWGLIQPMLNATISAINNAIESPILRVRARTVLGERWRSFKR